VQSTFKNSPKNPILALSVCFLFQFSTTVARKASSSSSSSSATPSPKKQIMSKIWQFVSEEQANFHPKFELDWCHLFANFHPKIIIAY
jgi:hypothetical protein